MTGNYHCQLMPCVAVIDFHATNLPIHLQSLMHMLPDEHSRTRRRRFAVLTCPSARLMSTQSSGGIFLCFRCSDTIQVFVSTMPEHECKTAWLFWTGRCMAVCELTLTTRFHDGVDFHKNIWQASENTGHKVGSTGARSSPSCYFLIRFSYPTSRGLRCCDLHVCKT